MLGKHEKVKLNYDQCDYTNVWKPRLLEHKRNVHSVFMNNSKHKALISLAFQPSENICPSCGVSEKSKLHFEQHVCGVDSSRKTKYFKHFKCEKCDYQTRYSSNLKEHQSIHNGTNECFLCDKCNYTTKHK